jgi:hypothetical protein
MNNQPEKLQIFCAEDCGNSPKKALLRDISIAFAKNEISFCLDWMIDNIEWDIVGDQLIHGKDNVEKVLIRMKRNVQQLHIHNIITHGNTGSVNGTLILMDQHTIEFCDVYNFAGFGKNAKIKKITSYVIKL